MLYVNRLTLRSMNTCSTAGANNVCRRQIVHNDDGEQLSNQTSILLPLVLLLHAMLLSEYTNENKCVGHDADR